MCNPTTPTKQDKMYFKPCCKPFSGNIVQPRNHSKTLGTGVNLNVALNSSVPPGFCDSAITEFITKSRKLTHFRKHPVMSSQCAFSQRKVVSQFEHFNEQPCILIMLDLQELHWTNEPKTEQIRARQFICSCWSRGLLSITRHRYTQRCEIHIAAGMYFEQEGL